MSVRACAPRMLAALLILTTLAVPAIVRATGPAAAGTLGAVGSWTKLPPPSVRDAAVALDRARNRLLVFGGRNSNSANNELWALALGGSPAWTRVVTNGTPPAPRHLHNMLYDPAHDELWLFGGADANHVTLNDVWTLTLGSGTPTWTQLSPTGTPPVARGYASAVLDTTNDRVLLFGGAQVEVQNGPPSGFLNDLWAMSLSGPPAWTELSPTGSAPSVRAGAQTIWDGANQRLVVYGGYDSSFLGDAYALGLSGTPAWSTLAPSGGPPPDRAVGSAVWDPPGNRMVIYGGYGSTSGENYLTDVWSLSLGASPGWSEVSPSGGPPSPRQSPRSVYDPMTQSILMYGGGGGGGGESVSDLTWSLSLGGSPAWTEIGGGMMPPREGATAIFDPIRHRLVAFGGRPYPSYSNEVWTYDLMGNWAKAAPTGTPPAARFGQSTLYDPVRDRMLVYGGTDSANVYSDVWALSLSGSPAWTLIATTGGPPSSRWQHVAVYDSQRDRMVIQGGSGPGDTGGIWALDLATNSWSSVISSASGPGFRQQHAAVYDPINDRFVMFGGSSDNAVWSVNFSGTPAWSQLSYGGVAPRARYGMGAAYDEAAHSMIVFGGTVATYDSLDNGTSLLHLFSTPKWTQLDLGPELPSPRENPMTAFDQSTESIYIGGGCCDNYDDTWVATIDHTTATRASMMSTTATPYHVDLKWWVSDGGPVTIERNDRSSWEVVDVRLPDGTGVLEFQDGDVVPGRRYGYRLLVMDGAGATPTAEVWVDVPEVAGDLALGGLWPNPALTDAAVSFTLPGAAPARLEVLDVAGRQVFSREVGGLGAGQHLVRIDHATPGLYLLRLTQAGRTVTAKATLMR